MDGRAVIYIILAGVFGGCVAIVFTCDVVPKR
jgi:hypothetical protein